jgi:Proteolipid membrane potential modulator
MLKAMNIVWVKAGICSADSLINILLCCLGYIPGLLHAWYIIAKYPEPCVDFVALPQDPEGGRVAYIYVQGPSGRPQKTTHAHHAGYGTTIPTAPPVHQEQNGTWATAGATTGPGEGSSNGPAPPPYEQAVQGDHKVQTTD